MRTVLLYGFGGHAKVVLESLKLAGITVKGFFDDKPGETKLNDIVGLGVYSHTLYADSKLLITIGNNAIRKKISEEVSHPFYTAIDNRVLLSSQSKFGAGSMVLMGSMLQPDVEIGSHVIVNTGAIIEHDCKISDYVHVGPGAVLCGMVEVGEGTLIGANAVVAPLVKIGKWCQISAGSSVLDDVPDYSVVMGVPGKIVKVVEPVHLL